MTLTSAERRERRRKRLKARRNHRYRRKKKIAKRLAERLSHDHIVTDYDGLIRAIKRRRQALGLQQLAVDQISGLPDGYQGKLECKMKHFGQTSLPLVLKALGLTLVVLPDETAKIAGRR